MPVFEVGISVWDYFCTADTNSKLLLGKATIGGSGAMDTNNAAGETRSPSSFLGFGCLLPDVYNGDAEFDTWHKHFNLCAAANGWDESKKLVFLPTRLRGRAFRIYENLPDAKKASPTDLTSALSDVCS